jgi:hypothetical protein
MLTRSLLALAALAPLAGCDLFSVEAEVPEVCLSFHDRLVTGVAPGDALDKTLSFDALEVFGPWVELDADITSATATLTARSGVADLSFIESITVVMRGDGPAEVPLVDCGDFACASSGMSATLADRPPADVNALLRERALRLDVIVTGALPQEDWVVNLDVCLSGVAKAALSL